MKDGTLKKAAGVLIALATAGYFALKPATEVAPLISEEPEVSQSTANPFATVSTDEIITGLAAKEQTTASHEVECYNEPDNTPTTRLGRLEEYNDYEAEVLDFLQNDYISIETARAVANHDPDEHTGGLSFSSTITGISIDIDSRGNVEVERYTIEDGLLLVQSAALSDEVPFVDWQTEEVPLIKTELIELASAFESGEKVLSGLSGYDQAILKYATQHNQGFDMMSGLTTTTRTDNFENEYFTITRAGYDANHQMRPELIATNDPDYQEPSLSYPEQFRAKLGDNSAHISNEIENRIERNDNTIQDILIEISEAEKNPVIGDHTARCSNAEDNQNIER